MNNHFQMNERWRDSCEMGGSNVVRAETKGATGRVWGRRDASAHYYGLCFPTSSIILRNGCWDISALHT